MRFRCKLRPPIFLPILRLPQIWGFNLRLHSRSNTKFTVFTGPLTQTANGCWIPAESESTRSVGYVCFVVFYLLAICQKV